MVLGFKAQFLSKIKDSTKIHTIREDKHNRWKQGMKIHFATGVRTSYYHQFMEGECISTQTIEIKWLRGIVVGKNNHPCDFAQLWIDGNPYLITKRMLLSFQDGFDSVEDFLKWFDKDFTGKIIHWTNFKY